jgi:hypothetical protein
MQKGRAGVFAMMNRKVIPLALLSSLFTLSAFAGLPSEDQVVAGIRDRFEAAHAPAANFQMTERDCTTYSTARGATGTDTDYGVRVWTNPDGYAQTTALFFDRREDGLPLELANNGQEILGRLRYTGIAFRVEKNGKVLIERTNTVRGDLELAPASMSAGHVSFYEVCD